MLSSRLKALDKKSYGAYKSLKGSHDLGSGLKLHLDRIQSDPFASPSLARVEVPLAWVQPDKGQWAAEDLSCPAFADFLLRRLNRALPQQGSKDHGSISIDSPGQQILRRAAVQLSPQRPIVVCLEIALPASGRRIRGLAAADLMTSSLPHALRRALNLDSAAITQLHQALVLYRDQVALREYLDEHKLVSFIADGSVLPRESGNSDLPASHAQEFISPESLRHHVCLPSGKNISGMGIPEGITLIVGGGYHGKSTLLHAIERGIYHHIAGDGREYVVTREDAVSLRAEEGRSISGVDISPFIGALPSGTDTRSFSTTNASGSTSQAAALIEALEAGAGAFLIDEDTSATNFMLRDDRMGQLVPQAKEPITPLIRRVRALYRDLGVSTIMVAGGSGAFIDVADQVICLDAYLPQDISERARSLSQPIPDQPEFPAPRKRRAHIKRHIGKGKPKPPRAHGVHALRDGRDDLDLSALQQLVDSSQTASIAALLARVEREDNDRTALVDQISALSDAHPGEFSSHRGHPGRLAEVRVLEIMAALNRHRGLRAH
ncbi:hypothetical protein GSS88_00835 [Corynebacterium sp. 3HC-13]|uniref:ABC-ATPase domain-containing protein n=1 Tax=Corynebacterium poyangense TaxID=2684405 RepID=UPI001CCFAB2A|nr:ABC-ATPase domain-containing protein [Corynebacterium poyangense]MBZ8176348.1 hypothetical protein [Corynebacterium poyangense]